MGIKVWDVFSVRLLVDLVGIVVIVMFVRDYFVGLLFWYLF